MNRSNVWIHIGLAVVLVTLAAVIGQIDRWRSILRTPAVERRQTAPVQPRRDIESSPNSDAEVLIRFKPGTSLDGIRAMASLNHDRVVDDIESVNGLVAID